MSNPQAPIGRGAIFLSAPASDLGSHIPESEHGGPYASSVNDTSHGPITNTKASLVHTPHRPDELPEVEAEMELVPQRRTTQNAGHTHDKRDTDTSNGNESVLESDGCIDGIRIYPAPISGRYSVCPPLDESSPRLDLFSSNTEPKKPGSAVSSRIWNDRKVHFQRSQEWSKEARGEGSHP